MGLLFHRVHSHLTDQLHYLTTVRGTAATAATGTAQGHAAAARYTS